MENKITIKSFTDLQVWQEGHQLVLLIYQITKTLPKEEKYCLIDQMRRAAISITSDIAEGFSRHGFKEKLQFYYMALGSVTELQNQPITPGCSKKINHQEWKEFFTQEAKKLKKEIFK